MRHFLLALALLFGQLAGAQSAAPTDVLLLINGDEISGQVLTVSGTSISYRALNLPDTLRFDTDAVFLIRFANGTSEVLRDRWPATKPPAPPSAPDALPGRSSAQRRALGLSDARRCYTSRSSFWISAGAALQGGPLLGVIAPAVITGHPVGDNGLRAPIPARLTDPSYRTAYQHEVRRTRRGKAWGGYALGTTVWLLLFTTLSNAN